MSSENAVQNVSSPAAPSVASPAPVRDAPAADGSAQQVPTYLKPEVVLISSEFEPQFMNSTVREYTATCVKQQVFEPTPDGRERLVAQLEAFRKWLKEHISTMQAANILLADIPFDLDLDTLKMIHDGSLKGRVYGVDLSKEPTLAEGLEKYILPRTKVQPPPGPKAVCNWHAKPEVRVEAKQPAPVEVSKTKGSKTEVPKTEVPEPEVKEGPSEDTPATEAAKETSEEAPSKEASSAEPSEETTKENTEETAKENTEEAVKENAEEAPKENTEEEVKESPSGVAPEDSSETPEVAPETPAAAPAAPDAAPEPPKHVVPSVDSVDMGIRVLYYPWRGASYRDRRPVVIAADLLESLNDPLARALGRFCLDLQSSEFQPGQSWPNVMLRAFAGSRKQAEEGTMALLNNKEAWKAWLPWLKLFNRALAAPDWTLYPYSFKTLECEHCPEMCGCGCADDPVVDLVLHLRELTSIHIQSYQARLVNAIRVLLQYAINLPSPYIIAATVHSHRASATKAALEALAALSVCIDRIVNPVEAVKYANEECTCQHSDDEEDENENAEDNNDDDKKDVEGKDKKDIEETAEETAAEAAKEE